MSQYPNYLNNGYMPQISQGYMQGYSQIPQNQNPYMERFSQLQAMQAPQQPMVQGIATRIVDDFNMITANDVPMDGNGAFFVKKDGSEIQHRTWTGNGTITTRPFKPVLEEQSNNLSHGNNNSAVSVANELEEVFSRYFNGINERFDKLEKSIKPTGTKRKDADNE